MGQTAAGTTFGISLTLPATEDAAGYAALTFLDVGEVTNIDEYGRVYELVTSNPLSSRRVKKYKGSYDEGSFSITYDITFDDAGQVAVTTARDDDANAAIEIVHQDGTIDYMSVKVMSTTTAVGTLDSMLEGSTSVEIDSDIIRVAP